MLKRTNFGAVVAFLAATSLGHAQDTATPVDANTVVASVNGQEITLGHMAVARSLLPKQYLTLPPEDLFDGILENLVKQSLLVQSLKGKVPASDAARLDNDRRSYLAGIVVDQVLENAVTEEELQALFNDTYVEADPTLEFNAAHILVSSREEAEDIVRALASGSVFATLARERSTGPTGPNGGNLGWFGPGAMVPAFEEAVVSLEDGAYSGPVESPFGWHVIHRLDSRSADVPTLESVRDQLTATLQERALAKRVETLTSQAEVSQVEAGTIDPTLLSDPSIFGK
jgi:peptidyl-prolyl cis-trans isomerase C